MTVTFSFYGLLTFALIFWHRNCCPNYSW